MYNLSRGFAALIAGTAVLLCGNAEARTLDLGALARHGRLEHDYSLAHTDVAFSSSAQQKGEPVRAYAPTEVDYAKLQCLLDVSKEEYLTARDLAQAQINLKSQSNWNGGGGSDAHEPLSWPHFSMVTGETCLLMDVFGREVHIRGSDGVVRLTTVVDKSVLRTWMGEERLPDGYVRPREKISLKKFRDESAEHAELLEGLGLEHVDRKESRSLLQAIIGVGWDAIVSLRTRS